MKKRWIYLAGVIVFGLAYAWLKANMRESVFFVAAIGYLLLLRLIAEKLGK
ncbi:MAG: hypothetical protein WBC18_24355 [Ottowia sp.]|uniref:hypothetical protein n=1 Tax=Ottowia sp. TaxID=1898956 RepID=UPI003C762BD8